MARLKIFKKDYIVGLDIGSTSVKLAQFINKQGALDIVRLDLREFTHSANKDVDEKEVFSAIKEILGNIDEINNCKFIVTINCPKTALKKVIVPYMPATELRDGITLEAKNYFPFPLDEALLEFEIQGEVVEKGIKKYQVVVATSPKKTVDRYLTLLQKVGIKPDSFIPIPYALQRLAKELDYKEGETRCFLDIGARYTELVIFRERDIVFSRKIPVSAGDVTKEMTDVLLSDKGKIALSLDEAERIKREIGIPREGENRMIDGRISTVQLLSMVRAPLEQLVNEIDRCFDYYTEESQGEKIDSLVLFGGGASLQGIVEFLSEELAVKVRLGNPLKDEHERYPHRLALAIGAGLSNPKGINLLPLEVKEETKIVFKRATVQAILTGVVVTLALIYIGMRIQLVNFQKKIAVAKMELSSLRPQVEEAETQLLVSKILKDEPYWDDVFKEISNIHPVDSYLTELSMEGKVIKIKGVIVSKEQSLLSDFIMALKKGIFTNVELVSTKKIKGKDGNEFELRCRME